MTPDPAHPPPAPPVLPGEDLSTLEGFVFVQSARGWRFGFDAVMLARHVFDGPQGDLLEIGTGCGVVAVLLAGRGWKGRIVAVEIQPALADRARRNVQANGVAGLVTVLQGDACRHADLLPPGRFQRVVANPPCWRLGSGRTNPDPERAGARHEFHIDARRLCGVLRERLAPEGLASLLYPPERLPDVLKAADAAGLSVVRRADLLPATGRPPEVVLLDLAHGRGRPCEVAPLRMLARPAVP